MSSIDVIHAVSWLLCLKAFTTAPRSLNFSFSPNMKRRNNKNTAINPWIFLDGPPQNAPRNPLVKYYTSWQSCLKRRRHLRPLSTLFLTLNHLSSAKWKHMSAFRSVYIWRILSIPLSPPSGLVSEHVYMIFHVLIFRSNPILFYFFFYKKGSYTINRSLNCQIKSIDQLLLCIIYRIN